jgi:CheY-like chemotaxis protein
MCALPEGDKKGISVLLVEDERMISDLAAEVLIEQGFAVAVVTNAGDALRLLGSGAAVDVLFTDINLLGAMDGVTLAQRAREMRPDLPVVYTSGRLSGVNRVRAVTGAVFVPKPYSPFEIGPLLKDLLAARQSSSVRPQSAA